MIRELREISAAHPDSISVGLQLARALSLFGDTEDACSILDSLPPENRARPTRATMEALVLQNCGVRKLEVPGVLEDGRLQMSRFTRATSSLTSSIPC